jgi:hypothetical protein
MREALIVASAALSLAGTLLADQAGAAPAGVLKHERAATLVAPAYHRYVGDYGYYYYAPYPSRRLYPPSIYYAPPRYYEPPPVRYYSRRVYEYAPPVYGWEPARPSSCGRYRYWNGEYCADARRERPYLGPKW